MADFRFYYPISVRYGDLDPQWHVNNARFVTYLEQARVAYVMELGLFSGESFLDFEMIVADVHVVYHRPIKLTQRVRVGVRVSRLGNKSMLFEYAIEDADTGEVAATAETVMVSYDFRADSSKPVPDEWRQRIAEFEGIPAGTPQ